MIIFLVIHLYIAFAAKLVSRKLKEPQFKE